MASRYQVFQTRPHELSGAHEVWTKSGERNLSSTSNHSGFWDAKKNEQAYNTKNTRLVAEHCLDILKPPSYSNGSHFSMQSGQTKNEIFP